MPAICSITSTMAPDKSTNALLTNWGKSCRSNVSPARSISASPPPGTDGLLASVPTAQSSTPNTTPPSSRSPSPQPAAAITTGKSWQSSRWVKKGPPPPVLECKVGRVIRMPDESDLSPTTIRRDITGDPWLHPAAITKIWEDKGVKLVKLRACTSFTNRGGIGGKAEWHHHYFVKATPDQLTSESDVFRKKCWVNCSPGQEFTIEYGALREWTGNKRWGAIQFNEAALDSFNKNEPWSRRDGFF